MCKAPGESEDLKEVCAGRRGEHGASRHLLKQRCSLWLRKSTLPGHLTWPMANFKVSRPLPCCVPSVPSQLDGQWCTHHRPLRCRSEEHQWLTQFPQVLAALTYSRPLLRDLSPRSPSGITRHPPSGLPFTVDLCQVVGTWSSHFCLICSDPLVHPDPPLISLSGLEAYSLTFCNKGWITKLNTSRHQLLMCSGTFTKHLHKQNIC